MAVKRLEAKIENVRNESYMNSIYKVQKVVGEIPYMTLSQAIWISNLMISHGLKDVLEIGFYHGVSTCYLAATVAPMCGRVTAIDIPASASLSPTAEDLLKTCELREHVDLIREPAGAAWHLMRLIERNIRFDFCFIDDCHLWHVTGFHFFLVEKLLRPGGYILIDDLAWTRNRSRLRRSGASEMQQELKPIFPPIRNTTGYEFTEEQNSTKQVERVWKLLISEHLAFEGFTEHEGFGLCRKKLC